MSNNEISPYLQIFNKRIFFDIASDGCGSGCIYCFTKHPDNEQSLLEESNIDELCDKICEISNSKDYIVSFCPNTEPMKSDKSRALVYYAINRLQAEVKYFQIATKECIPVDYLEQLNSLVNTPSKIRISISLPYLDYTDKIEPYAANIEARLQNFERIKNFSGLCSILYLRPFNSQMTKNRDRYINIINTYNPDEICVGAEFVPKVNSEQLCTFMYDNDLAPSIFLRSDIEDVFDFANHIRQKTNKNVFFSSICNIANQSDYGCILNLKRYDQRYCYDCTIIEKKV